MKIDIEKCSVTKDDIMVIVKCIGTFKSLQEEEQGSYRYEHIQRECVFRIADKIAAAFLAEHKMDIVNALSKEDIVSAIQLKIVEGFSLNKH